MSFKIRVPASGHEFDAEENETILEAALRQGVGGAERRDTPRAERKKQHQK